VDSASLTIEEIWKSKYIFVYYWGMGIEQATSQLKLFTFEGRTQPVSFVSNAEVTRGVVCDVYSFIGDPSKDLGIIKVEPGCKTPLQKVLKGERTIEGYFSGKGRLIVKTNDSSEVVYRVGDYPFESYFVTIGIGETMQWQAAEDSNLVVYEICFPPYEDGRFENLPEQLQ